MAGYDAKQARHLDKIAPLTKPMLWSEARSEPLLRLSADVQSKFDALAHIERRYCWLPRRAALSLRKLLAYSGRNQILTHAGRVVRAAFTLDLKEYADYIRPGLALAAEYRGMRKLSSDATSYGSGVGYQDESHDLAIAQRYRAWHQASLHFATEEERLGSHYYYAIHNTTKFLKSRPAITEFINFGTCYGIVDHELALHNPNVTFYAVDRAPSIKTFNDALFQQSNLSYVAADIMSFLDRPLHNSALFFQRTMMIFPEPFVAKLFSKIKGIAAVIGIEPFNYSVIERKFMAPSIDYQPSLHQGGIQFLHNYPHFCRMAGLKMIEQNWMLKAADPSAQTYCFTALRGDPQAR